MRARTLAPGIEVQEPAGPTYRGGANDREVRLRVSVRRVPGSHPVDAFTVGLVTVVSCGWLALVVASIARGEGLSVTGVGFGAILSSIAALLWWGNRRVQRVEVDRAAIRAWSERWLRGERRIDRGAVRSVAIMIACDEARSRPAVAPDALVPRGHQRFELVVRTDESLPTLLVNDLPCAADAAILARHLHAALGADVVLDVPREFFDPPPALAGFA